jgi:hypothetical protein
MLELIHLQPQEDFPEHDINEGNVDILKTMLCDPGIKAYAHETVERVTTLYRISHVVLRELIGSTADFNGQGAEWFNAGVIQYESAASLLRLDNVAVKPPYFENLIPTQYMTHLLTAGDQANYFDKAHTRLLNEQPNLCEVIETVTKKTVGSSRSTLEHALLGAAVQRQIEIDAIYDTRHTLIPGIYSDLED